MSNINSAHFMHIMPNIGGGGGGGGEGGISLVPRPKCT